MKRAELLAQLNSEQKAWEALLAEIGEDRMQEPGVQGEWSIKDIVAHLTAWRRRTVGRLEAVASGQPEPKAQWPADLKDDDEINAWFHERDRSRSVREALGVQGASSKAHGRPSRKSRKTSSTIRRAFHGWKARL